MTAYLQGSIDFAPIAHCISLVKYPLPTFFFYTTENGFVIIKSINNFFHILVSPFTLHIYYIIIVSYKSSNILIIFKIINLLLFLPYIYIIHYIQHYLNENFMKIFSKNFHIFNLTQLQKYDIMVGATSRPAQIAWATHRRGTLGTKS